MARGTFFEVAKEAENLGNMDETQFYGSSYAEWFENEEDPASLEYLFSNFRSAGISKRGLTKKDNMLSSQNAAR